MVFRGIQVVHLPKHIDLLRHPAPVSLRHSNVGLIEVMVEGEIFYCDVHGISLIVCYGLIRSSFVSCVYHISHELLNHNDSNGQSD